MTIANFQSTSSDAFRTAANALISADVMVVCLWSMVGMSVTAMMLVAGWVPMLD